MEDCGLALDGRTMIQTDASGLKNRLFIEQGYSKARVTVGTCLTSGLCRSTRPLPSSGDRRQLFDWD